MGYMEVNLGLLQARLHYVSMQLKIETPENDWL
jgi:hypothetical protein